MDQVARDRHPQTYNGPLEAGIRAVAILGAAFPRTFDLHRLTALDYLLTRTGEIGGPPNIHPPSPIHVPATEVRRKVIQKALLLMMTRDLVDREVSSQGIRYIAGDAAAPFLDALQGSYMQELKIRADWLAQYLAEHDDAEFEALMRRFFDDWVAEFQAVEQSLGSDL